MRRLGSLLLVVVLGGLAPVVAVSAAAAQSPHADLARHATKALLAEQIEDLQAGRGMGLALPAELSGYPGPRHVLDLADELDLDADQQRAAQALFDEMQAGAVPLGERIIEGEAALERSFATGEATEAGVHEAVLDLARLQGELRAHHLRYHIVMRELLTPQQIASYQELRGYTVGQGGHAGHH